MIYTTQTSTNTHSGKLNVNWLIFDQNQFFYSVSHFLVRNVRLVSILIEKTNSDSKSVRINKTFKFEGEQSERRIYFAPRTLRGGAPLSRRLADA